ncbi:MAG: hypothetical protein ACRD1P_13200 [Thermoanaerobaculia bacterium]
MDVARSKQNQVIVLVAVGAAAVLLSIQLLIPPVIGLADNGDFEKVMGYAGFQYSTDKYEDKYWSHIVTKFVIVRPGWWRSGYLTSETLLASVARLATEAVSGGNIFDIRVLGGLHMFLLLVAIGLIVSSCRDLAAATQWLVAFLLVFVFTDVGYAAKFNSFYSETASLLFLLLTVSVAALAIQRGRLAGGLLLVYFLCAVLFVGSKPQESIQGPLLAVFALRLASARLKAWWRQPAIWMALGLCAFSFWYYRSTPVTAIRNPNLFDNMFMELLPNSPDPRRDLDELGLAPDLLKYSGTHAYMANSPVRDPAFQTAFFDRFGYRALLRFYLSHPARLFDRIRRGAHQAFRLRPNLGNFERAAEPANTGMSRHFACWSELRLPLNRHGLLWITLLLGGNLGAIAASYRRSSGTARLFREGVALVVLIASTEFVVCALAAFLMDIARHLYIFQALFDLILLADVAWLVETLWRRRRAGSLATVQAEVATISRP